MALRDMVKPPVDPEVLLKQVKADVEARVFEHLDDPYVEIPVPFDLWRELQAWVESEGMLCGSHLQAGRVVSLVIHPGKAPTTPEQKAAQAAAEAEVVAKMQAAQALANVSAEERIAAIEAKIAEIQSRSEFAVAEAK